MTVVGTTVGTALLFLCCIAVANGGLSVGGKAGIEKTEHKIEEELKHEGIPPNTDDQNKDEKPPADDDIDKRGLNMEFRRGRKGSKKKKGTSDFSVENLGVNLALMMQESAVFVGTPRENILRKGFATDTDSCDDIREVPDSLRDINNFFDPVDKFYQKYTEAYGIPILGSLDVTDEGLRRACYEVKFLLACRYDIRNAYYLLYGRIALIGDNEQQTSLFEYREWDKNYWDNRVRGMGPSLNIPLTSAGDDNQRCKPGERYAKQDILVHEFCHAIHLMGAVFTIEGFQRRLISAYNDAKKNERFKGLYAATNKNEYFAVGCQIYHDSLQTKDITYKNVEGETITVSNRHTLKEYDPALVALLDEVFPCGNHFVHRCTWKDCDLSNFEHVIDKTKITAKSQCPVVKFASNKHTAEDCAEYTCYHLGNAFNFKKTPRASYCYALRCDDLNNLDYSQTSGAFDVYKIKAIPVMDQTAEKSTPIKTLCTSNVKDVLIDAKTSKSKRCNIAESDRVAYGPTPKKDSQTTCEGRGGCYASGFGCYFPTQEIADHSVSCFDWASDNEDKCTKNPVLMLKMCPLACHANKWAHRVEQNSQAALSVCHDDFADCTDLDCPKYGKTKCKLQCKECTKQKDWKDIMGIPDLNIPSMIRL